MNRIEHNRNLNVKVAEGVTGVAPEFFSATSASSALKRFAFVLVLCDSPPCSP